MHFFLNLGPDDELFSRFHGQKENQNVKKEKNVNPVQHKKRKKVEGLKNKFLLKTPFLTVSKEHSCPTSPEENVDFSQLNKSYPTLSTISVLDSQKTRERKVKQKKQKKSLFLLFFRNLEIFLF